MVKRHIKCMVFLLAILAITGCQESPDSDIIVNKNENKLEQAINKEADEKKEKAPEKKEDSFKTTTKDVTVTVKAQINAIEEKQQMAVVKVIPHVITSDDLKKWGEVLFAGKKVYDPGSPSSKKEIEDEILSRKQKIGDRTALLEEYGGNEEEVDSLIKEYEETITNLEAAYKTAPDTATRKETDYTFHPYEYYMDEAFSLKSDDPAANDMNFEAETDYENGQKWGMYATERTATDYEMHAISFFTDFEDQNVITTYKKISDEEAVAIAEDVKQKLGMEDWTLAEISTNDTGLIYSKQLVYSHCYEGVPALLGLSIDLHSDDLYAANLYYESFAIRIDNGKVASVDLYSPMDVAEIENNNVKTLTFDEVYEKFKNQMQSQYSKHTYVENGWIEDGEEYENAEMEMVITEIEQGMCRIKIKDSSAEYRMVPAWVFSGYTMYSGHVLEDYNTYVVINAIDGSVINPTLGY